MILKLVVALALALAAILVFAASKPSTFPVQRSI